MAHLVVNLLGIADVRLDGHHVVVDTRKAIALLAYLAVTGRAQSRDSLAALLWDEYDEKSARAALRRTLSALRAGIGGDFLAVERDLVTMPDGPGLTIDVRRFRELLGRARGHGHPPGTSCSSCLAWLDEAASLYRDDFMAGFSLRDGAAFEDWHLAQAEELRRELSEALDRAGAARAARGDVDGAIEIARRRLGLDPLHEPVHQDLMRLYQGAGRRAEALRQYRECVAVLDRELAVSPLEETTRLYQAIKEDREPAQPFVPALDVPDAPQGPTYLAGRKCEMAVLMRNYAAMGRFVAVEGEAGVGKTRLVEELMQYARAGGATVLVGRCYDGESHLAYAPFLDVLRTAVRSLDTAGRLRAVPAVSLAEATRLLPDLLASGLNLPAPPPLDNPGAQSRFLDALAAVLLAALNGTRPGLLVLEDLHWADHSSLDLVATLMRHLRGDAFCLVLTWRGEQVAPGHWLRRRAADLQRAGLGETVHLGRLDEEAVCELVRSVAPDRSEADIRRLACRLHAETEGLPLFVHAYLSTLDAREASQEWTLPGTLRDVLRAQFSAVSEMGWQVLGTGAVIGHSFDFETVRIASGRDEERVIGALEELIGAGLITEIDNGSTQPTYDFNHEKLREIVYDEISLARRRLLHRRVAEALIQRSHGRADESGKIASHYRLAGDDASAAEYYRRAGDHARSLYANREALGHYQTALALGCEDIAGIHMAIGDLQTSLGEYTAAVQSYETAAAFLQGPALAEIEHKLGLVYGRMGEWDLADSYLRSALETLGSEGYEATRARIYADRSLAAHHGGRAPDAETLAEEALTLAEASEDRRARAQARNTLGILANARGDHAAARDHLERSLTLAEGLNDGSMRAAAANNLALAARMSGDLDRARLWTEEALALSAAQGDRHREAALHNNLADLLHLAGRSAEAIPHVRESVSIYAEIGVEEGAVRPEIWKLTEW